MSSARIFVGTRSFALLAAVAAAGGCHRDPLPNPGVDGEALGEVTLALQVAPGVQFGRDLTYTVKRKGDIVTSDTVPLEEGVIIRLVGLVVGSDYSVLLEATTSDLEVVCGGYVEFAVRRTTTVLTIPIVCDEGDRGGPVIIKPDLTPCERISAVTAVSVPSSQGQFDVSLTTHRGRGKAMIRWASGDGWFTDPHARSTRFICSSSKRAVGVSILITDPPCDDTITIELDCSGGAMGMPGGGSVPDSGVSEACRACEQNSCRNFDGLDLYAGCYELAGDATQGSAAGSSKASLCVAAADCMRQANCAKHDQQDISGCYCGTTDSVGCLSGLANGPCRAELEAAAESADPTTTLVRMFEPTWAIGGAGLLVLICDGMACRQQCVGP